MLNIIKSVNEYKIKRDIVSRFIFENGFHVNVYNCSFIICRLYMFICIFKMLCYRLKVNYILLRFLYKIRKKKN